MSGIRSLYRGPIVRGAASGASCPIYIDSDDNIVKIIPAGSGTTEVQLIDASSAQTLTSKTLTSPTLTTPTVTSPTVSGAAGSGVVRVAGGVITELNGDGAYSISVTIPAGAVVIDLFVTAQALWTAGTSATLIVGDTADPDGFITGVDAKAAPAVGTSVRADTVPAGAVDGAYLGDTNGEFVAPTSSNFGRYYAAGSIITATVTKVGSGTAGRTQFTVVYAIPEAIAQVVV